MPPASRWHWAAAAEAIRRGEIDLAVAGGVSLYLSEWPFKQMSRAGMLSPTGTPQGDAAEAEAIARMFSGAGTPPWVNATKAITGHGLFAAGLLGIVATVLQMRGGFLHANPLPTRTIPGMRLVGQLRENQRTRAALCNAFGFGGLYASAVVTSGAGGA